MAIIKIIKNEELSGGTDNTSVYPVTTSKAVYDADNRSLQDLIESYDSNIENVINQLQDINNIENNEIDNLF